MPKPPRLEKLMEMHDVRCQNFGVVSGKSFGRCLSILIAIQQNLVESILLSDICKQLKNYGLFPSTIYDNPDNAPAYKKVWIGSRFLNSAMVQSINSLQNADACLRMYQSSLVFLA
jgi:hypothetical protein